MRTRGQVIEEYKTALENGTEGERLLETVKLMNTLSCSEHDKAIALRQEIDHIICGYLESKKYNRN